jgi:hypothetical protein
VKRAALAIVVSFAGCKPETARQADRAAEHVVEQRNDLAEAVRDEPTQVPAEAKELSRATELFIENKRIRIAALRGQRSVIGTQFLLISSFAEHARITDAGRADVNNALTELEHQLETEGNQIDGLATVGVDEWNERDDQVRDVMSDLESAAKTAWRALEEAPRIHPNAS